MPRARPATWHRSCSRAAPATKFRPVRAGGHDLSTVQWRGLSVWRDRAVLASTLPQAHATPSASARPAGLARASARARDRRLTRSPFRRRAGAGAGARAWARPRRSDQGRTTIPLRPRSAALLADRRCRAGLGAARDLRSGRLVRATIDSFLSIFGRPYGLWGHRGGYHGQTLITRVDRLEQWGRERRSRPHCYSAGFPRAKGSGRRPICSLRCTM